jgi:hypothetical protein
VLKALSKIYTFQCTVRPQTGRNEDTDRTQAEHTEITIRTQSGHSGQFTIIRKLPKERTNQTTFSLNNNHNSQ